MPDSQDREQRLRAELAHVRQRIAELERLFSSPQASPPPLPDTEGSLGLLAQALVAFAAPDDLAEVVLAFALEFTRSPLGFVGYLDQAGNLVCPTLTGGVWDQCRMPDKSTVIGKPKGLIGWALTHRRSLLSNSPATDSRAHGAPPGHIPIQRFLGVPALMGDRLLGMVAVANGCQDYTPQDQENLERLASLYALALERSGREMDLERRVRERTEELLTANEELQAQIEQARRAREELETFFATSPDLMAIAGADGYLKRVNSAFMETLGYSEHDLLTRPWLDFVHPEDRARTQREGPAAYSPQGLNHFENRYICADGSTKWLSWAARPGSDPHTTFAVARDISRRKRAEERLRLEEARNLALLKLNEMQDASKKEICDFALEEAVRLTGSQFGYLYFMGEDGSTLSVYSWSKSVRGVCQVPGQPGIYRVETTGLWGEAVRQRKAIVTNDYAADNPWKKGLPEGHVPLTRHMNIPIMDGNRIVAVAGVANKAADYDDADVHHLQLIMLGMWRLLQRQQTAQALKDSEERFRLSFHRSPLGMTLVDEQGRFMRVNDSLCAMLGYAPEELAALSFAQITHPEDRESGLAGFGEMLAGQSDSFVQEKRYLHKDGRAVWTRLSAAPVRDAEGNFLYAVSQIDDITARKQAEETLRLEGQRTRSLLRLGDMAEATRQEICDMALDEAVRLTGSRIGHLIFLSEDEMTSTVIFRSAQTREECAVEVQPAIRRLEQAGLWAEAARRLEPVIVNDYAAVHPAKRGLPPGHPEMTRYLGVPIFAGGRVAAVAGVANKDHDYDETDVHHLQLIMMGMWRQISRRQAEEALAESEERFRTMVETAEEAILVYDSQTRITFVNRKAEQICGWSAEELLGRSLFNFLTEDNATQVHELLDMRRQGHRGTYELGLRRKDGGPLWVLVSSSPLLDKEGVFAGALVMATDITRRREMEEELRKTQKLESLAAMAGGVAHDFNNLLQSILGNADLALMDLPPGSPAVQSLMEVQAAGQRAAKLSHQMLAYSGHTPFLPQSLDLGQFLREILPDLRRDLPPSALLEADLPPGLSKIDGDPGQLRQAMTNLVINGAEALGGRPGCIRLSCRQRDCDKSHLASTYVNDGLPPGRYLVVEVADNGPGMDRVTMNRAFDPFFSTKFPGRGLGLAVVLGIARGHRGAVALESAPGIGTKVRLYLPTQELTSGLNGLDVSGAGPVILVVDDDETVRLLARRMLERHGYRVLGAVDGWQGLKVLKENCDQVRLALVDLTMPGPTGSELTRRMREICPGLPVVLSSSYDQDEACAGMGPDELAGFLRKPFRMASLLGLLGRILQPV